MFPKKFFYFFLSGTFSLLFFQHLNAQKLPSSVRLDESEHIMYTGDKASEGLYDESQIRVFQLWFSQANYWQQLKNNYQSKTDLSALLIVDGDTFPDVGVRFKGQTSYSQTQSSDKKSFNISLGYTNPDQELDGYSTINLNNCFEDASFMREVSYLHQIRKHVPAAKACYVHLFINGASWGVYPNIQQLNRDYIKDWYYSKDGTLWRADAPSGSGGPGGPGGGWGDGTAAFNYLGSDTTEYQDYYTLKSTDKTNPWDDLVKVCEVLNQTPLADLEAAVSQYLDLDRTLWFLASEIAFSDDDGYVYKGKMDYYLYWDPETGRMTPLEFDGNSVMKSNATSWGPFYNANKVNYPLLNRLLAVPSIRQRYLAHMRTLLQDEMNPTDFNALVDQYDALIKDAVTADPKKLYTVSQYTTEKQTIKNFVQNHRNNLLNNTEVAQVGPVIQNAKFINAAGVEWGSTVANEAVTVTAAVTSASGIGNVSLYYSAALTGNFTKTDMFDDGQHQDGTAGDGVYGASIPGFATGSFVRFYIGASAANTAATVSYAPAGAEHNVYFYRVSAAFAADISVVINEIMSSNTSSAQDENGQFEDWIELYNLTNQPVDMSGYFLSDNPDNIEKWTFPAGTTIAANGYLIVWADEDGLEGPLHASFKLSAAGETLKLANAQKELLDTLNFPAIPSDFGYARVPNGTGPFVIQAPTFNESNVFATATNEVSTANRIKIYPTLASDFLQVDMSANEAQVRILDTNGKTMLNQHISGNARLNINSLPAGSYAANVVAEGENVTVVFFKR